MSEECCGGSKWMSDNDWQMCCVLSCDSVFFFLIDRRPPENTPLFSSAASDGDKRQLVMGRAA